MELLRASCHAGANELLNAYVDNEQAILTGLVDIRGIKSEFYCKDLKEAANTAKFLSIYSDFISVFMLPNNRDEHLIHYYPPEDHRFIKRNITFPAELLSGHIPKPQDIIPGYTTHADAAIKELAKVLDPFVERGRLLIRPIRTIMLYNLPGIKQDAMVYYAGSDTPNDDWKIKQGNEKDSFVIDNGLPKYQSSVLYEITLPFIENIEIKTLDEILTDETDLIGKFRITLKDLMMSTVNGNDLKARDIYNDKLRPELETLNRKFNAIKNIHKLGTSATVAAITLSLIAVSTNMTTNFQTLFNAFAGTSTIGFLASEFKFQTEEDKLKDNPYFLLWRISRSNV